ncbi:peptidase domain-containing ABC transporter [Acidiphilium acidophilum]|uniref:Peptidase domain-containing ABC transporter n=1 Tax=Acidiphilium acidophilum TaxID=76588 RepID=A0AAW9DNN5_ACIAO|nr:peptidase domain-containing ABC transporter [Acidiphilium acidophilum]MDX5930779.1 peptidase domain-containing ABC transporter [Acidiphilium acidophilum]
MNDPNDSPGPDSSKRGSDDTESLHVRILAVKAAARFHGVDLDIETLTLDPKEPAPSSPHLVDWLRDSGLWVRGIMMNFRQLMKVETTAPVVLLLRDGGAALMVANDPGRSIVFLRDPRAPVGSAPVAVDEIQLRQVWDGAVLLVRGERDGQQVEPPFNFSLLLKMVLIEKRILRDVAISSITLTILQVLPILMIMVVLNTVIVYRSINTLILVTLIFVVCVIWEALLTWGRRMMLVILSNRIDARLNLMIFDRLMTLPIDFFEKNQAGELAYKTTQIYRVRDFITGRLLSTFIDMFMVALIMPILFYLDAFLAWTILIASGIIAVIITAFLPAIARLTGEIIAAESAKGAVLVESVYGIRTVKALALEKVRANEWDTRVAETSRLNLQMGRLSNWPVVLSLPFERYAQGGVLLLGGYLAVTSQNPLALGGLVGFMLLGGRVAGPLVSFARLIQDAQEARAAVAIVGQVLNRPTERRALTTGLRPQFVGSVAFENVTFTYEGTKTPALNKVSFAIPEGTMLGIVGRSGSGKSTVTRLLQGINREYTGAVKIDNTELREINLRHLRKSFGVVLQDNFLFRGSVRDNIIAGRPGLSFEDAIKAARLAGAEEFIERLPQGYETFIQEGSPNLSGGQKQRLAIARALIADPRLLILDEATSALDPESEALINANLLRIARGRTMVIISHRLASLVECDQILVMDSGQVIDLGKHGELVERCAIYRHLWLQQNRHMNPEGGRNAPTPTLAQGD